MPDCKIVEPLDSTGTAVEVNVKNFGAIQFPPPPPATNFPSSMDVNVIQATVLNTVDYPPHYLWYVQDATGLSAIGVQNMCNRLMQDPYRYAFVGTVNGNLMVFRKRYTGPYPVQPVPEGDPNEPNSTP